PYEFARRLFDLTDFGMTVVVEAGAGQDAELAHPPVFAPAAAQAIGAAPDVPRLSWFQAYRWTPEKSATGPLTILISTVDERVVVMRNGIEIGRARINVAPGVGIFGTQAYVLLAGDSGVPSSVLPDRPALNWQSIPMPGYTSTPGARMDSEIVRRVSVSPEFARLIYDELKPGTTLVLTDAAVLPKTTGQEMTVITAEDETIESPPPADGVPPR
ncbi:MAG: hypothetical protein KAY03_02685, partial [Arenimonas sp.]|nr:hypothetical protein [Arenimonas sp.]